MDPSRTTRTPSRRQSLAVLLTGLAALGAGLLVPSAGAEGPVRSTAVRGAAEAPDRLGVRILDGRLTRDGRPFLPRGANMIGALLPDACPTTPDQGVHARAVFGRTELLALRDRWHANTVRLQVSQRGLDPQDAISSPEYLARVRHAVRLARDLDLVVVLSMQDQSSSCGPGRPLPTAATERAWRALAPQHLADPDIVFELYNEPQNPSTAAGWEQWRHGGAGPVASGTEPAVGHAGLVDLLRGLGARNVLLADGANKAGQLQGLPVLDDPQVGYAVHPYWFHVAHDATLERDRRAWDLRFGDLSDRAVVVATEWNASNQCSEQGPTRAPDLLAYLEAKGIGLTGHAFDVPGTLVAETRTWAPSTLDGFSCTGGRNGADAGALVQATFAGQARAEPAAPATAVVVRPAAGAVVSGAVRVDATTSGGAAQLLVDGAAVSGSQPFTWASPDDGLEHVLEVRVSDGEGRTTTSAPVAVRSEEPAGEATGAALDLTAEPTGKPSVALAWQPSPDEAVTGYRVYRDGVLLGEAEGTSYEDLDVGPGQTRAYSVRAVVRPAAVEGEEPPAAPSLGDPSVATAVLPDVTAPSAPADLTVQLDGSAGVDLTWQAGRDDVGVVAHRVHRDGALLATVERGSTWSDPSPPGGAAVTYAVDAVDAAGSSSTLSAPRTIRTPAPADTTAPTAPLGLRAARVTATSVTLAWSAARDDRGVTRYLVSRDGAPPVGTSQLSKALSDLAPATTYTLSVQARDAAGNVSPPSEPLTVTTLRGDSQPPTAPTRLRATAISYTSTTLAWQASSDNQRVTGYLLSRDGSPATTVSGTSTTVTGLLDGTAHRFVLRAVDAAGNVSSPSQVLTVTTRHDDLAPGAPAGVTASSPAPWAVDLQWRAATDAGGSGVAGYRVYRTGTSAPLATLPASATAFRDTTVRAGTGYAYTVQAVDGRGNAGTRSTAARVTTGRARETRAPTRPTGLTARTPSPGTVSLAWTASHDTALVGYHVLRDGRWVGDSAGTSYVDATAPRGIRASWTVVAFDTSANVSPPSAAATAVP